MECQYVKLFDVPLANPADRNNSKRIFDTLGFVVDDTPEAGIHLRPPVTNVDTPEGRMYRRKLLRAWVEISAWVVDFRRIYGIITPCVFQNDSNGIFSTASHFKLPGPKSQVLNIKLASAREEYQSAIGAHPDQSR